MIWEDHLISNLANYRARRQRFFGSFGSLWSGTLLDAFDLLEVFPLTRAEIASITQAAEAVGHIYKRVAALLRTVPDNALLQMGLPPELLNVVRQRTQMPDTVIGRLDLVKTGKGYKLLEFNADTSGLVVETFPINAKVCEELGEINPNEKGEAALILALENAICAGITYVGKNSAELANIVFTAQSNCERDRDITSYLMGLLDLPSNMQKQFVPLELLRADQQGLYDSDGKKIDVLYRFYPLQLLGGKIFRAEKNRIGSSVSGSILYDLVINHRLAFINPPSAFLMECKAVQSVIWGLSRAGIYFDADEQLLIERYFLPTFMDAVFTDDTYVVKPVYGSDGDTITIANPRNGEVSGSDGTTYLEQPMVYQKYVKLPRVELMTEYGPRSLSILTSCFLIDGRGVGITLRAGEFITDFSWWSVPVCAVS